MEVDDLADNVRVGFLDDESVQGGVTRSVEHGKGQSCVGRRDGEEKVQHIAEALQFASLEIATDFVRQPQMKRSAPILSQVGAFFDHVGQQFSIQELKNGSDLLHGRVVDQRSVKQILRGGILDSLIAPRREQHFDRIDSSELNGYLERDLEVRRFGA